MKYYLARLRKLHATGVKFLDFYTKQSTKRAATILVQQRYPGWKLLSLRSVGKPRPVC